MTIEKPALLIDIDGTILFHEEDFLDSITNNHLPALPEVRDKLCKWHCKGYQIVLITARPESLERLTREQLANAGIVFDRLVMGICPGIRYIINDKSPRNPDIDKAVAINLQRNEGFAGINLP